MNNITVGKDLGRAAIEDYIKQRDDLWHLVIDRPCGEILRSEIEQLFERNEIVAFLLRTKVVAKLFLPERIGIEKLRVNVCNAFVARVRLEIRSLDTKPKIEPLAVIRAGIEATATAVPSPS